MIDKYLDAYGVQARLRPALLALFPIFITVAVWLPALYEFWTGLVGLAVACGITTAFTHIARARGRIVQQELIKEWGGLPTTLWLRQSNDNLDLQTKQRYFAFLENNVPNWTAPTENEEAANLNKADQIYGSAVRWLLEYSRDVKKFPLILKENISYGFRRNALGIRIYAIFFATIAIGIDLYLLFGATTKNLAGNFPAQVTALVVSVLLLLWWFFAVNQSWVRDAADAYARALLAACDTTSPPA